jgi:hypothetical protein
MALPLMLIVLLAPHVAVLPSLVVVLQLAELPPAALPLLLVMPP